MITNNNNSSKQSQLQQQERTSRTVLFDELCAAGAKFHGKSIYCPFHDDKHPSGTIYQDEAGVWRYKCHAGSCGFSGDVFDVRAKALGLPLADVLQESRSEVFADLGAVQQALEKASLTTEARYLYTNPATGKPDLVVFRLRDRSGRKTFRQLRPASGGGYVLGAPAKPWPLYNRKRLAGADTVVVVEGEKCVHALHKAKLVATTSPAGAGKAEYADWRPLAGKEVYLWPDNDEAGRRHMRQVAERLKRLPEPPAAVYMLAPDKLHDMAGNYLPEKGDAADLVEMMSGSPLTGSWIYKLLEAFGQPLGAGSELAERIETIAAGGYQLIDWPWSTLTDSTRSLLPGTITIVCGDPGATKSLMMLQAFVYWHEQLQIPCSIYELEEDLPFHLSRVLVQLSGEPGMTDIRWIRDHADQAREILGEYRQALDRIGRDICISPDDDPVDMARLVDWVRQQAVAGKRIIVIDPITAAQVGEKIWLDDLRFLMAIKAIARESGCSIVLVTHPKQVAGTARKVGLDYLAGGAAYQRFAQTVLWLERPEKIKESTVRQSFGPAIMEVNRILHVSKARLGPGAGKQIAMDFSADNLTLRELGVIESA